MTQRFLFLRFFIFLLTIICLLSVAQAEQPIIIASSIETIPSFDLPSLDATEKNFTQKDLGHCALLSFWGSWCDTCREEHPLLITMSKQINIPLFGIAANDPPENARAFLKEKGNPYQKVGLDPSGLTAARFGVKAVPETFLVGNNGQILYHQAGPLTEAIWRNTLTPLIRSCR